MWLFLSCCLLGDNDDYDESSIEEVPPPMFVGVEKNSITIQDRMSTFDDLSHEEKNVDVNNLKKLADACPLSTPAERLRFLIAKGGDYKLAEGQLTSYLDWRQKYKLETMLSSIDSLLNNDATRDEFDWQCASNKALSFNKIKKNGILPQIAKMLTINNSNEFMRCEGHRILQLLPAKMNPDISTDEIYTLCVACYLDIKLGRRTTEKIIVTIDVRGGEGWYNSKPKALIPFIKKIISCLGTNFPERLLKSIVFPMPRTAMALWKVVKVFLDPNTAKKIGLIAGNASRFSSPPYDRLQKHLPIDILQRMEEERFASFVK